MHGGLISHDTHQADLPVPPLANCSHDVLKDLRITYSYSWSTHKLARVWHPA